jgi:hypothetical protein
MEYMEVMIYKDEATRAKSIPNASTLKAISAPGAILNRVNTTCFPDNTAGSIETTIRNLIIPAINVQDSLTLGLSEEETSIGITRREARTAKRGLIEIMVSIYYFAFLIVFKFIFHFKKGRIIVFTIVPE